MKPPLTTVRDFSEGFCGCFSIAGGEETLEGFEGSERRCFWLPFLRIYSSRRIKYFGFKGGIQVDHLPLEVSSLLQSYFTISDV